MSPRANNLPKMRPLAVRDEGSIFGRGGLKNRASEQRDDFSVNRKPKGRVVVVQIPLPQPTMRTEKDIGARNPVTTTVTGFFIPFFQVKLNRYPKPKTAFGEDLN